MEYRSDLANIVETATVAVSPKRPRRHRRHRIHGLAYVNLDHANGGIIRNLSEAGIAIQAVSPLHLDQQVHLRFELLSPRMRIETTGRVAWADSTGQVGVEFLALSERSRHHLKEWLFVQLLAAAQQAAWTESVFDHSKRADQTRELMFSAVARPAIHLAPEERPTSPTEEQGKQLTRLDLHWYPISISARSLAGLVDGLILLSALLLFSLISVSMTQLFPAWPIALVLSFAVAAIFAAIYWLLFVAWIGITPGERLAQLAGMDTEKAAHEEERPRFR